jgi:hypothetical protein
MLLVATRRHKEREGGERERKRERGGGEREEIGLDRMPLG